MNLKTSNKSLQVAIIGAGISGICMAIKLQEKGIPFTIFEKNKDIGGTWLENTYPGSGCDVPSFLYSFSFAPKPDWSRKWAKQAEILAYLKGIVEQYNIRQHIRFETEVQTAVFDETTALWTIHFKKNGTIENPFTAHLFICAVGQLNRPKLPNISGIDTFQGKQFHSARWQHDIDLSNKTVGVIGNGASAIQFVPEIAPQTKHLYLYQRTPSDILPKDDYAYSTFTKQLFKRFPSIAKLYRWSLYWEFETRFPALQNKWVNKIGGAFYRRQTRKRIGQDHPDLLQKTVPDYTFGCKRILISNDYFDTLKRPNVSLVTEPIKALSSASIETQNQTYPLDIVIYATGFRATEMLYPLQIINKTTGQDLNAVWQNIPHAYWGMTLPAFPNFFMLYGPNTNLRHNSIIFMTECQVNYVVQCVEAMLAQKVQQIQVKQAALNAYQTQMERDTKRGEFASNCNNWYTNEQGKIVNNTPYSTLYYWYKTRKVNLDSFDFF